MADAVQPVQMAAVQMWMLHERLPVSIVLTSVQGSCCSVVFRDDDSVYVALPLSTIGKSCPRVRQLQKAWVRH